MAAKLVITGEAQADIVDALGPYERISAERGNHFLNCVQQCIDSIVGTPKMHSIILSPFRRAMIRGYPYAVFYMYENDVVSIHCVVHTSRDSSYWKRRLP